MQIALQLVGGLILLMLGGEMLVRGAVQVANRLGVSPLVIGLTLVGFGTSTPELVTSVQAALSGSPGIAYGNIVGSNIANILLILGIAAIITPIAVSSNALKRDSTIMVLVTVVFAIVAALVPMGLLAGLVFVLALAGYIFAAFWQERGLAAGALDDAHGAAFDKSLALQEADPALKAPSEIGRSAFLSILIAIAGLALVVLGGNFLVSGAVGLARSFSISETIIGLTIVAIGTSMPELVTSVMAALRKQTEVAFGNVVGSNIYNILGIGGFTALISPTNVPSEIVRFDNLIMIGASLVLVAFAFTGRRISRREGAVLVAGYAAYVALIWP
ncbi:MULTISPECIES: calcium/sodium antiporter [Paracoccus]|uniref:Calcium/sodium antiporter n=1 Tax=Paracoccus aerius TaxID=1915382 RepID=A0ABS1S1U2_9RHOB|nr:MULTISPECIES: calcium/sodium antiporter [Paracoccus]MBL3672678.1 calcium/sodium antiporter [Paracoccus aerius]QIR84038.1 calcium/sodium antiporter [Paracoccus sp. AK26]GHG14656.1 sodium:calcium antiporter [Paracoccus aerius]